MSDIIGGPCRKCGQQGIFNCCAEEPAKQPRTKTAMHITAINLVRKGNYACVEICTEAGWTEVISEFIDAPFSHTVHEAGMKARIDGTAGVPYTLPIPDGVSYNIEADNFYDMSRGGMGSEFYRVWKERREEFPRTIRRG